MAIYVSGGSGSSGTSAPISTYTKSFFSIGEVTSSEVNTNRDGTGPFATIATAVTDTRIDEIQIMSTGDLGDCVINIFVNNGASTYLMYSVDPGNPSAASSTAEAWSTNLTYTNLLLPAGHSLRAAVTVTPISGNINFFCQGAREES